VHEVDIEMVVLLSVGHPKAQAFADAEKGNDKA
jgi:hypothetical protein